MVLLDDITTYPIHDTIITNQQMDELRHSTKHTDEDILAIIRQVYIQVNQAIDIIIERLIEYRFNTLACLRSFFSIKPSIDVVKSDNQKRYSQMRKYMDGREKLKMQQMASSKRRLDTQLDCVKPTH